jgi:hypothetical protein
MAEEFPHHGSGHNFGRIAGATLPQSSGKRILSPHPRWRTHSKTLRTTEQLRLVFSTSRAILQVASDCVRYACLPSLRAFEGWLML